MDVSCRKEKKVTNLSGTYSALTVRSETGKIVNMEFPEVAEEDGRTISSYTHLLDLPTDDLQRLNGGKGCAETGRSWIPEMV